MPFDAAGIRKFRKECLHPGLSQQLFAQKIGVAQNTIWRWENAEATPDAKDFAKLLDLAIEEGVVFPPPFYRIPPAIEKQFSAKFPHLRVRGLEDLEERLKPVTTVVIAHRVERPAPPWDQKLIGRLSRKLSKVIFIISKSTHEAHGEELKRVFRELYGEIILRSKGKLDEGFEQKIPICGLDVDWDNFPFVLYRYGTEKEQLVAGVMGESIQEPFADNYQALTGGAVKSLLTYVKKHVPENRQDIHGVLSGLLESATVREDIPRGGNEE